MESARGREAVLRAVPTPHPHSHLGHTGPAAPWSLQDNPLSQHSVGWGSQGDSSCDNSWSFHPPPSTAHSRRRLVQSNKNPKTLKLSGISWADSSLNPTGLQGTWPGWTQLPKVPANCTFKAETPCSAQQVKNNLKAHIPWERAQGWEGRNSHSWVTPSAPAAIGICWSQQSWLNPSVSHGRGQLLQRTLGRCQDCWNGMGLVARISQRCPSPAFPGSPRLRAEAGDEQLPTAALLAPCWPRLWGLAEPQLPMASSLQPWPRGQPVPRRGSRAFSLSHGKAHRTRRPGELSAVSFLAGSVGKSGESGGCAPRPCSRASHPRAGRSLEPPEGNV